MDMRGGPSSELELDGDDELAEVLVDELDDELEAVSLDEIEEDEDEVVDRAGLGALTGRSIRSGVSVGRADPPFSIFLFLT